MQCLSSRAVSQPSDIEEIIDGLVRGCNSMKILKLREPKIPLGNMSLKICLAGIGLTN